MFKLMKKYLSTLVVSLILIILLLIVQATGDLKLPDYTSDIVNVGIQQGGIKYAAPKTLRKASFDGIMSFVYDDTDKITAVPSKIKHSDFQKILAFVTDSSDKSLIKESYKKSGGVYVIQKSGDELNNALAIPSALFFVCDTMFKNPTLAKSLMSSASASQSGSTEIPASLEKIVDTMKNGTYSEKWAAIEKLSSATKKIFIDKILSSGKIDETMLKTVAYMWCAENEKAFGNTSFGVSNTEKKIKSLYEYKDGIYHLKDTSDKNLEYVEKLMSKPITLYSFAYTMVNNPKQFQKMLSSQGGSMSFSLGIDEKMDKNTLKALYKALGLGENATVLDLMKLTPSAFRADVVKKISDKFGSLMDTVIDQYAVSWVGTEYKAQGIDTNKIQIDYLFKIGFQMLGVAAVIMTAACLVTLLAGRTSAKFGRDVRRDVFGKVIGFSGAEFNKFSTASLITRSTNDIQQMQILLVMLLRMVLYAPIIAIGAVIKIFGVDGSLAWIIGLAAVLVIITVIILFRVVSPKFQKMQALVDRLNLVAREILSGLPVIRAFGTQDYEKERFDKANVDFTKVNLFTNRTMAMMFPLISFVMSALSCAIIWFGTKSINQGSMQVGNMMAYLQYAIQILMAFIMISMVSIFLPRAKVAGDRVFEVISTESSVTDKAVPDTFMQDKKGLVEFNNVSFKYPGSHEDSLSDINFSAKAGEITAVIGGTGSGKSTLVNLIPRFYDATDGEIKIDGVNVKDADQHELRRIIGFVPQKAVLFSGTIDSNLRYGRREASDDDIAQACDIAQASGFIDEEPEKYNEPIAQAGSNVSGGQKQRLAIARAIVKDPEILVFDDSFSALDFKTDRKLRDELKKTTSDKTVIIVAQRISTIKNADRIIVLYEGRQVGDGTHDELMKNCEEYRAIALSQLSEEELKR